MTKLDAQFERKAEQALLDGADSFAEALGERLKDTAEANFKAYAARNGYDIDHIWTESELEVRRLPDSYRITVEWPGLTALFEFGVDPHTIEGDLAFEWLAPPAGTRPPGAPKFVDTDSVNWGSVTGGIGEARAIRDALDELRARGGSP
jgi:hypothetical protein